MGLAGDLEGGASTPDKGGSSIGAGAAASAAAVAPDQPGSGSWPFSGHYWEDAILEGQPLTDKQR